jgi:hypothetical protein
LRGVMTDEAVCHSRLQFERAEVVADQATGSGGLIAAAERHAG